MPVANSGPCTPLTKKVNMKDLYECHITCSRDDAGKVQAVAKHVGWKFSQIDGDPVLGKEVFCYLTTHDDQYVTMYNRMEKAVACLQAVSVHVVRKKIELTIYDTKRIPV